MSRQIQIRRGTAAENDAFTGAIGEVTMDTTNNTLRVHDGTTAGGTKLAKQSEIPNIPTVPTAEAIAHIAMPSNNFEALTFGASGTTYTAPADGWFVLHLENYGLGNHWVNLTLNGTFIGNYWAQVANNSFGIPMIPCGKNGTLQIDYGSDIKNTSSIKFLYANVSN